MYLKVHVPANKGTRLLLRSTNASHLLLLISEPRLGWLDHQHPAAAQPKSPWEHPPADHPHRPGSHQQSHCPLSSFQKLNFAAHFDQIFYLKHMRSPPKTRWRSSCSGLKEGSSSVCVSTTPAFAPSARRP